MPEYDFQSGEIEQRVAIAPVPKTLNQSLNISRFKQQNMDSHRKVLKQLETFMQESRNKQNERIKVLKQKQKNLGQQIMKQQEAKQLKRKQLQQQQKQKFLQQCTFKPKLNSVKGPKRNFTKFLENQYAHTQKVKQKCQSMKKNIQQKKEKATYKPKINQNFSKKKQKDNSSTVFERLYALSEKQSINKNEPVYASFHPIINQKSRNMIRQGPVQKMLYQDALRRQQKGNQVFNNQTNLGQRNENNININNQKYAAQKFIKQYFFTLQQLQVNTSSQHQVDYVLFNQLLKKLGFVSIQQDQQTNQSSVERTLVHDAYQLLQKTRINAKNICVFMLSLIGIYQINPVNFQQGQESDEQHEFSLDEVEGRKLQKQFNLFYRNRLSSDNNRRSIQKVETYNFHPSINKQSSQLADKYRNNMLQEANKLLQQCPEVDFNIPQDGIISHTDLLVLNKIAKDLKKQKTKEQRIDQQLKQCTFKPATISSSLNCSKVTETNAFAGSKKSSELYEYYKQMKSKKDLLKVSRKELADPQCTFKPNINKNKIPKVPLAPAVKQTQQTLYRMHKGRQQHEQKQKYLQRGQKLRQRKSSVKQQTVIPSLILDVNLGQKVDRILLYRGDEVRLNQVAHQFALKHSLDQQSKKKLLQMLKIQLQNVLSKIDQDQQSQDCEY